MTKKYIFFDIDGTLTTNSYGNSYVPESTKLALQKLREKGHFLSIATGRSYAMAVDHMKELGFENMVSDGGNGITINHELIDIEPLNYANCMELIEECKQKGLAWGISPDNSKQRLVPDNSFQEKTQDVYMKSVVVNNLNPLDYDRIYKVYVACDYPQEYSIEAFKKLPWCRFEGLKYIFVEPNDKSVGIKKMVKHFNGDIKDVIVFGDAGNDLSMFIDEWTSVAMGNAIDELKKKATFVTDDVDKDGIYSACVKLGLFD